jgi:cyclophilin family peptidyl-prolyl cis-trans isomerase
MNARWKTWLAAIGALLAVAAVSPAQQRGAPVIVVETSRGTFAFETLPEEAPKSVAHVLALVRRGFYDGQRVHRAVPGFVIQWGDPQTRDTAKDGSWGRGAAASSGEAIGAAELSNKRPQVKGVVGLAHFGDPSKADSQLYVTLAKRDDLVGRYAVVGRVVAGTDVPERIERGDLIQRMYVRE